MMRRSLALAVLLVASLARAAGTPPASCPIGTNWTEVWTRSDPSYGTVLRYEVTSPCHVFAGTDFTITVRVQDPLCVMLQADWSLRQSGFKWKLTDTRIDNNLVTTLAAATGWSPIITDSASPEGEWVLAVTTRYSGIATDHRIGFSFTPRVVDDCYLPGMGWSATVIGTTTYDPYPPGSTDPGGVTTPVDPVPPSTVVDPVPPSTTVGPDPEGPSTTTVAITGCSSSGVTPALLGLVALLAAGWPRRRARS
jgi:uncharacterized protein (TIGR03382 family)